jgi:hypothetical protein
MNKWAIKWGVPYEALEDLRCQFGMVQTEPEAHLSGDSEAAVQTRIRMEASRKGCRLWRNNIGATLDDRGNFIRYGLCNDSKQMSSKIKSSDLIGIKPVTITPDMVGTVIGQFLAREVKVGDWKYTGTPREKAQLKFIELVNGLGGDAAFASSEVDVVDNTR